MKYVIRATKESIKFINPNDGGLKPSIKDPIIYNVSSDPRLMINLDQEKIFRKLTDSYAPKYYNNLKKAITDNNLNYGTFQNWKSKNKIDYPITYRGFLFEKVDVL